MKTIEWLLPALFIMSPTIGMIAVYAVSQWLKKPKRKVRPLCPKHLIVHLKVGQMCVMDPENCHICKKLI